MIRTDGRRRRRGGGSSSGSSGSSIRSIGNCAMRRAGFTAQCRIHATSQPPPSDTCRSIGRQDQRAVNAERWIQARPTDWPGRTYVDPRASRGGRPSVISNGCTSPGRRGNGPPACVYFSIACLYHPCRFDTRGGGDSRQLDSSDVDGEIISSSCVASYP
jgi:hypothetical protein